MSKALLGIDTGGTFTDFVLLQSGRLRVHKVLSDPRAPQEPILQGIADMGLEADVARGEVTIVHGTTVATNATLEGKGVRTVYITNKGLKDVLRIGRQTRRQLYNLTQSRIDLPFDDELTLEVDCRLDANGREIRELDDAELEVLKSRVAALAPESIAINLLFSFLDPAQETRIEALFTSDYFVSRSSKVLPEYREYERGVTTWVNAWIGPLIKTYLSRLNAALAPGNLAIMQSSGLTIAAPQAAERAVNLLLSGPAGGLSGSMFIGQRMSRQRLMTFDMGGTSSDVALLDGKIRLTGEGRVADFPIGVPMADIHTIGAGGGSIAFVDEGGLLQVGPASAGADPGPACYDKGGTLPTVTDANLILGRLREDAFLGGSMVLNRTAAEYAIAPLARQLKLSAEDTAFGIVKIANAHMTQALRVISVQRGFDPRAFSLVCFGGAGGLHFCDLAEALQMDHAIVPVHSGVLSALGMLSTPPGREMVLTHVAMLANVTETTLIGLFDKLEQQGRAELANEGVSSVRSIRSLDLRYAGQTFTINTPWAGPEQSIANFHTMHRDQYGHQLTKPVELLNVRVHLEADREYPQLPLLPTSGAVEVTPVRLAGFSDTVPVYKRESLPAGYAISGPALVTERHSTTLIKQGWTARVDPYGNFELDRTT